MPRKTAKKTKVRKPAAKASGNGKVHARVIRIVVLTNPKTKREALQRVNAEGRLIDARAQKRFDVKRVERWTEVEADTWAEATKLYRAGKGVARTAAK